MSAIACSPSSIESAPGVEGAIEDTLGSFESEPGTPLRTCFRSETLDRDGAALRYAHPFELPTQGGLVLAPAVDAPGRSRLGAQRAGPGLTVLTARPAAKRAWFFALQLGAGAHRRLMIGHGSVALDRDAPELGLQALRPADIAGERVGCRARGAVPSRSRGPRAGFPAGAYSSRSPAPRPIRYSRLASRPRLMAL